MNERINPGTTLETSEKIQAWLISRLAATRGLDPRSIDRRERFSRYGLDSQDAAGLLAALSQALGRPLAATLVWEHPTIEALAGYLTGRASEPSASGVARASRPAEAEPIAIIGLSCRFPKAPNAEAFWRLLCDGVDAISEVPKERWDIDALYDADPRAPGKMNTRWGGFLEQVDGFDPLFFGISPREAMHLDPQQRLMMELSWEALEDAGLVPDGLKGSPTGVFFGAMWSDYAKVPGGRLDAIVQHTATGQDLSIIPARISYTLGLQGPSVSVNTACSSSLVAVHLACQSLRSGESTLALCGGVNLILSPESTIAMSKFGAMAPDGRSKAFDARANGYVRGEGGGVVVLKPLSLALADGDPIYCVIRGSAVNNDGFSNGLTAPNPKAQEAVLREAYARAGVKPADVHYVEAHGTGTILGDPIEANALGAVLGEGRPASLALRLGSVKTNIGHLEAAAGVAGLIKMALAIKHRLIPPSLHFQEPNPHIAFEHLRLEVQQALGAWPDEERQALAGVSSFGFGGTNCHVVLEGTRPGSMHLLPLSADSAGSLVALAKEFRALSTALEPRSRLPELCSMAAARLSHHAYRLALTVRSYDDLSAHLESFLQRSESESEGRSARPGVVVARVEDAPSRLVFVFGGHGSQWLGMGQDLLRDEPVFRAAIVQCEQAMRPYVSWSLLAELTAGLAFSPERTDIVQPAIFAVQVALAALWRAWGIEPDAVVGQSIGEVAAAHVAGALSLQDAACVICRMGELAQQASARGGAAVLDLSLPDAKRALADHEDRLWVAGCNSPNSTVVSGDTTALEELLAKLHQRAVTGRRIKMDYAPHSPHMDALCPRLLRALKGINPRPCATPFYSTVTGSALGTAELGSPYWVRNLREPVLFASAVERLLEDGYNGFLDVNPHPILTHAVEQILAHCGRQAPVLPSLRRQEAGRDVLLASLGALYARGASVHFRRLYPIEPKASSLPALPELTRLAKEVTADVTPARDAMPSELLVLSARSEGALEALAGAMSAWLTERRELLLTDLCYTASVRRHHHDAHRLAVVGRTHEEISASLDSFVRRDAPLSVTVGRVSPGARSKVVFVFPGQGSQWAGMGRALLAEEPVFRHVVEACDTLLQRHAGFSLLEELLAPEETSRLHETEVAQPALFALEVALVELWASWGVRPDAVIGHSVGEVAAAHVAGVLSLEEAVRVVYHRGRLMQRATGLGKMAAVEMAADAAAQALSGYEGRLTIAAVNDPGSVVLSGEEAALSEVLARLSQQNEKVRCRELRVNYAFHSPQMAPIQRELVSVLGEVAQRPATVAMYSTVNGERASGGALDAAYWGRNVQEPVQFAGAVKAAIKDGHRVFLEVGPHPVLTGHLEQCLEAQKTEGQVLFSLRRGQEERRCLLQALGALHAQGLPVDLARLYADGARCVPLPSYPWQRERYWLDGVRKSSIAADYYDAFTAISVAGERGGGDEKLYLTFGPFPEIVPGFSWLLVFTDPEKNKEQVELAQSKQLELREALFRHVDFSSCAKVLDFGCGYATDLIALAEKHGHLELHGYTISGRQADVGARKARDSGLGDRVKIHRRDSARDPFPDSYDLIFGFEVAHHIRDKKALFSNVHDHLNKGGALVLADFISNMASAIEHEQSSSFFITKDEWVDVLSFHRLRVVDCVDISREIANFLHDPDFDQRLEDLCRSNPDENVRVAFQSYDRLGKVLLNGLASYVLLTARREDDLSEDELLRLNQRALGALIPYADVTPERQRHEGLLYALDWRRKEPAQTAPASPPSKGGWLLLTDQGETGAALGVLLRARGETCVRVVTGERYARLESELYQLDPTDAEAYRSLLRDAFGNELSCRGVLHLWSLDATAAADTTAETLEADQRLGSLSALYLAQALVRAGWRDLPRLFLVTRGAQAVGPEDAGVEVSQAPVWGLGRTLALEHPELRCTRVDLSPMRGMEEAPALLRELLSSDGEDQIALREEARYVARLVRGSFAANEGALANGLLEPAGERPFRLESAKPGLLERLTLREAERRSPAPGEVEIEVEAAGLNFLDVLSSLGALPEEAAGPRLGSECAGRIVAVGEGVTNFQTGQEVFALAMGSFTSFVTTKSALVVPKPARFSFEQAAALPIAFLTAYYALAHVGRLRKGERVLIHAGAGGVGMAAVQWAQHVGAEVFATAGSEEKRSLLRSLGVAHVMDSRSLQFAEDVMHATNGEGVDVVLNSLSGEFIATSLGLLRDDGRFLEIGKRDYHENKKLGLRPFLKSLSFSLIDLRGMILRRPAIVSSLLDEIMPLFEASVLKPLPSRSFPISRAAEAFSTMAQARHTGKIVLSLRDPEARIAPPKGAVGRSVRADGSYLITGGLGGLGLSVAQWMVREGARHLVLVSRSGPSEAARSAIAEMKEAGAEVLALSADVSRREEVADALREIDQRLPQLRGIVHAAGVLDDRTVLELSRERLRRVMAPKMLGAWNLHALTRDRSLDFFVLYSSIASLLGSPGQGNYAAGNAFLDALAHHRRRIGLPGMSINWGPFSDVGMAAAKEIRGQRLTDRGMRSLTPAEGLEVLGRLLGQPRPQVGVTALNPRQWREFYPSAAHSLLWAELLKEQGRSAPSAPEASRLWRALSSAKPAERPALLEEHLGEELGRILSLPPSRIDRLAGFTSLGMDSLMSLELRNRLESSLKLKLSSTLLFTYSTLMSLARYLLKEMKLSVELSHDEPPSTQGDDVRSRLVESVERLAEEELLALFDEPPG